MFEKIVDRVTGNMDAGIHALARRRLPELVHDILEDAVARWAQNNWDRFDQREVNCTVQLYRWLKEAQRADKRFHVLEIVIENLLPSPEMLDATASVTTAARSDLRIGVRQGELILEAKRLASSGPWCKEYVHNGIARFVNATYAATESLAMMIGYVQQPAAAGLRDRVNHYVLSHVSMGLGHELTDVKIDADRAWLASSHQRPSSGPIQLRHLWIVLPGLG